MVESLRLARGQRGHGAVFTHEQKLLALSGYLLYNEAGELQISAAAKTERQRLLAAAHLSGLSQGTARKAVRDFETLGEVTVEQQGTRGPAASLGLQELQGMEAEVQQWVQQQLQSSRGIVKYFLLAHFHCTLWAPVANSIVSWPLVLLHLLLALLAGPLFASNGAYAHARSHHCILLLLHSQLSVKGPAVCACQDLHGLFSAVHSPCCRYTNREDSALVPPEVAVAPSPAAHVDKHSPVALAGTASRLTGSMPQCPSSMCQ